MQQIKIYVALSWLMDRISLHSLLSLRSHRMRPINFKCP